MKKFFIKSLVGLLLASSVCGCDMQNEAGNLNKSALGGLGGAVAGAWIGSNVGKGKGKTVAIATGTLLGAFAGQQFGQLLDKADIAYHNQTQQQALEFNQTGSASIWENPDSGISGSVMPSKTYIADDGRYCREYTQTIKVGEKVEEAYGKACRQPDGTWQIIS